MSESCRQPVLLIDDDQDIVAVVGLILEQEGFPTISIDDGNEALARLRAGLRPSLILLDLMMPGMDGWEFRSAMRAEPLCSGVPLVLLSGAGGDLAAVARELGACACLPKPFELVDLLRIVRSAVAGEAALA